MTNSFRLASLPVYLSLGLFIPFVPFVAYSPSFFLSFILSFNQKDPDTQRYRLGVNNQMLPINAPKCPFKDNHVDGLMHFRTGSKASREINYFPSTVDKVVREASTYPHESEVVSGRKGRENAPLFNDYVQAGNRWRSFDSARQQRFADRVALTLSGDRVTEELEEIWLGYWGNVDPNLAEMIEEFSALPFHPLPSLP
jgi:catalase